jgi:hypothetical protein
MRAAILLVAALGLGACGGGKKKESGPGQDGVVSAWQAAGLHPDSFAKVDGRVYGDGKCQAGQVDGLATIVCEYPDEAALDKAVQAGYGAVGDTTGAVVKSGRTLLVVADRAHIDKDGKRLNLIANVFRGKPAR